MQVALAQARDGRLHILEKMRETIDSGRGELSAFAPRMLSMKINPALLMLIPARAVPRFVRWLKTGTQIDISDDGAIVISSADLDRAREASAVSPN